MYIVMKPYKLKNGSIINALRWSYTVPALCYVLFLLMTQLLMIPLKPNLQTTNKFELGILENTFEVRVKNSNFNSDSKVREKNEYLVNVNVNDPEESPARVLTKVFQQ